MIEFLAPLVRTTGRGQLVSGINVFQVSENYRIPDLTFVASERDQIIHADGTRGEGPDAVIEIRSPDDETYDKLPFYARIGVKEVIVIDRDSKRPEVYTLAGSQYVKLQPDREGWTASETMRVRLRATVTPPVRLCVVDGADETIGVEF